MGVHIVAGDQVGLFAIIGQLFAEGFTKELAQHRNAQFFGCIGGAVGWLDAQARNPGCNKVFEQITVVRSHFDHMAGSWSSPVLQSSFQHSVWRVPASC